MHHQTVFDPAAMKLMTNMEINISVNPGATRYVAAHNNSEILYDVYPNKVVIIREREDQQVITFTDTVNADRYNFEPLSDLMIGVCYLHNKRNIELGRGKHTVMIHVKDSNSRFIPSIENSVISMHERKGVVFTSTVDNFHCTVADEVVCSMFIERMGHSLIIFDDKFTVRFRVYNHYEYFPLSALYMDDDIRALRFPKSVPHITPFNWKMKRDELERLVEDFTAPIKR